MRKKIATGGLWVFLLMGMFGMIGCGGSKTEPEEDNLQIVTSFYPMYVLTLNVTDGVEGIEVINMAQPQTGCLHDYQLTTADMKVLDGADVLVINGAGMESFLDKVTEQMPQLQVITATEGMDLLEDTHEMHLEEGEEGKNPHVWVSPSGAAQEALNIAAGLAQADPGHAVQYQENAQKFSEEMQGLKDEMKQQLDTLPHRQMVTFHEAFPYFAREFGFEIAAVIESEPGQEPVAKEIDAVMDVIRKDQIPAVFVESQYTDHTAQMIADETGAKVYELDLVVTGDETQDVDAVRGAYAAAMRKNVAVLMEALQ